MDPNNPAYQESTDNRADQLNKNNPEYKGDEKDDPESWNLFYISLFGVSTVMLTIPSEVCAHFSVK